MKTFPAHATHCHGNHLDNVFLLSSSLQQQPLAPPTQTPAPPSSTNYSSVDMELTCLSTPNPAMSTTSTSTTDQLTAPCSSSIHASKRPLEPEEEDRVPQEFLPLGASTPNVCCYLKLTTAREDTATGQHMSQPLISLLESNPQ